MDYVDLLYSLYACQSFHAGLFQNKDWNTKAALTQISRDSKQLFRARSETRVAGYLNKSCFSENISNFLNLRIKRLVFREHILNINVLFLSFDL